LYTKFRIFATFTVFTRRIFLLIFHERSKRTIKANKIHKNRRRVVDFIHKNHYNKSSSMQ